MPVKTNKKAHIKISIIKSLTHGKINCPSLLV